MGYCSDFVIKISKPIKNFENVFKEVTDYNIYQVADNEYYMDNVKWYEHVRDMIDLSIKYENILFELYVAGEDREDEKYYYFLNGKYQYEPVIKTWGKFDPTKLKKP